MMKLEEYKEIVKKEYEIYDSQRKEKLKEQKPLLTGAFFICFSAMMITMILSLIFPMTPIFDIIGDVAGLGLCVVIIYVMYGYFKSGSYPKKKLEYILGEKTFNFKPSTATKEKFMKNLKEFGFTALFIRVNDKVVCLEVKLNEDKTVGDCIVNFHEPMKLEEFLNFQIDGIKIGEMEQFEILSINFREPMNFNAK